MEENTTIFIKLFEQLPLHSQRYLIGYAQAQIDLREEYNARYSILGKDTYRAGRAVVKREGGRA